MAGLEESEFVSRQVSIMGTYEKGLPPLAKMACV